jgi:hypothetical protein
VQRGFGAECHLHGFAKTARTSKDQGLAPRSAFKIEAVPPQSAFRQGHSAGGHAASNIDAIDRLSTITRYHILLPSAPCSEQMKAQHRRIKNYTFV